MRVKIVSVGDIVSSSSSDTYVANLIVLVEGQSSLLPISVLVPKDKLPSISEGSVLDVYPTRRSSFSVRKYEADGKSHEIASAIDNLLKRK